MKVRTLKLFNDLQSKQLRKVGEVFEVSEKRASEILASPHDTLIEVIEAKKEVTEPKGGEKDGTNRRGKAKAKN